MINLGTFADDTLLWSKPYNKNNKQKTELLQRELNSFAHWSTMWKLVINADKCDYLRIIGQFTKRFGEPPKLSIAGTQLKQVDHLRYLGLWLDDKLNFNHHIEKTKMTCMGRLSSLYRLAINYDLSIQHVGQHLQSPNSPNLGIRAPDLLECESPRRTPKDPESLHPSSIPDS